MPISTARTASRWLRPDATRPSTWASSRSRAMTFSAACLRARAAARRAFSPSLAAAWARRGVEAVEAAVGHEAPCACAGWPRRSRGSRRRRGRTRRGSRRCSRLRSWAATEAGGGGAVGLVVDGGAGDELVGRFELADLDVEQAARRGRSRGRARRRAIRRGRRRARRRARPAVASPGLGAAGRTARRRSGPMPGSRRLAAAICSSDGEHPVEDGADVGRDLGADVLQRAVDVEQPLAEPGEDALELDRGRAALGEVALHRPS